MPGFLIKEFHSAQKTATIGFAIMLVLLFAELTVVGSYVYGFAVVGPTADMPMSLWIASFAGFSCSLAAQLCLASFLRCFSQGADPLGKAQHVRLLLFGVLYALRSAIEALTPPYTDIVVASEPIQIVLSNSPSGVDLTDIAIVVFIFCVLAVVRYGGALKSDSDSMV